MPAALGAAAFGAASLLLRLALLGSLPAVARGVVQHTMARFRAAAAARRLHVARAPCCCPTLSRLPPCGGCHSPCRAQRCSPLLPIGFPSRSWDCHLVCHSPELLPSPTPPSTTRRRRGRGFQAPHLPPPLPRLVRHGGRLQPAGHSRQGATRVLAHPPGPCRGRTLPCLCHRRQPAGTAPLLARPPAGIRGSIRHSRQRGRICARRGRCGGRLRRLPAAARGLWWRCGQQHCGAAQHCGARGGGCPRCHALPRHCLSGHPRPGHQQVRLGVGSWEQVGLCDAGHRTPGGLLPLDAASGWAWMASLPACSAARERPVMHTLLPDSTA